MHKFYQSILLWLTGQDNHLTIADLSTPSWHSKAMTISEATSRTVHNSTYPSWSKKMAPLFCTSQPIETNYPNSRYTSYTSKHLPRITSSIIETTLPLKISSKHGSMYKIMMEWQLSTSQLCMATTKCSTFWKDMELIWKSPPTRDKIFSSWLSKGTIWKH